MDNKKTLTLAIAGLSLLLAASITSTVAWYTGSTYLAITDINIHLKDPNLEIATENLVFKNQLDGYDLNEVNDFTAVTTAFSYEWLDRKEETPIFKNGFANGVGYVLNKPSDYSKATFGYFSQTFYLKCDIDAYITFDKENTKFIPDVESNERMLENEGFMNDMRNRYSDLNESDLKIKVLKNLNNVVNSMRFSILILDDEYDEYDDYKYFIYDPNKTVETYLGGILDTTDSGYYSTYNNKEVLYGEIISSDPNKTAQECVVYDNPLLAETNLYKKSEMTCFNANNFAGDMKFNKELSIANGLVIKTEDSFGPNEVETQLLIPVNAHRPRKIVLSFYQEGWDLDNTNLIVYSHFLTNMQFMIAPVAPRF